MGMRIKDLARQLERELALKDSDLLLERDRADRAESQLAEAQRLHELDERIIRVSADAATLQNNKLEKAEEELSEAYICEQCDGNTEGVHFCTVCWNNLAIQKLKALAQVKMLVEAASKLPSAKHCPDCPDQGWYSGEHRVSETEWEQEQVQCEFCYSEPLSVFNVLCGIEEALAKIKES